MKVKLEKVAVTLLRSEDNGIFQTLTSVLVVSLRFLKIHQKSERFEILPKFKSDVLLRLGEFFLSQSKPTSLTNFWCNHHQLLRYNQVQSKKTNFLRYYN